MLLDGKIGTFIQTQMLILLDPCTLKKKKVSLSEILCPQYFYNTFITNLRW